MSAILIPIYDFLKYKLILSISSFEINFMHMNRSNYAHKSK